MVSRLRERDLGGVDPAAWFAAMTEKIDLMKGVENHLAGSIAAEAAELKAAAQRELLIQNPYFAPPPEVVTLLSAAIERGVRVRILTAGPRTDSRLVRWAGHFVFADLLQSGVEIHEFQPTLNHQKIMVVDREWSYLGSANFDDRYDPTGIRDQVEPDAHGRLRDYGRGFWSQQWLGLLRLAGRA